jgi:hypothetical protein
MLCAGLFVNSALSLLVFPGTLVGTSCADIRLAGGDSPKVIGRQAQQLDVNYGHNKRILVVPQV